MAKALPDSLTPRKLMSVTRSTMPRAISTRQFKSVGNAETICATPDEIETATVSV